MKMLPTAEQIADAVKDGKFTRARKMAEILEEARHSFLNAPVYRHSLGGSVRLMRDWIASGLDVNVCDETTGMTALHMAMGVCDPEAVEFLIENGARETSVGSEGKTPLDLAVNEDMKKVLEAALEKRKALLAGEQRKACEEHEVKPWKLVFKPS